LTTKIKGHRKESKIGSGNLLFDVLLSSLSKDTVYNAEKGHVSFKSTPAQLTGKVLKSVAVKC
jgi:hypothetical protein